MQHSWSLDAIHLQNAWLTIGSFDGVHLGHQEIIRAMTAGAHSVGSPAVVLTFHPHPAVVLGKRNSFKYLTTPEERARLLAEMGVDVVITQTFNRELASKTAEEFMTLISHHLELKQLWVGYDFALGRDRGGDLQTLRRLGEKLGYEVHAFSAIEVDDRVISSTQIRELISTGQVSRAMEMLGRPYRLGGRVVPGDGRGRTIGIPTANLAVWKDLLIPKVGVYVCRAEVDSIPGRMVGAVTNIGLRPTFESKDPTVRVETHLLDFDSDLYEQELRLDFLSRLRDEQRFPNIQALIDQIHADIEKARRILEIRVNSKQ